MPQTLTFTKVFKAEGEKNGKSWTRWDYKTQSNERFVHFAGSQELPLNQAVLVEVDSNGTIREFQAAGNTQEGSAPNNGSQAVSSPQEGFQGHQDDAVGKTKAICWAQMCPALFNSLPSEEQTIENAKKIIAAAVQDSFSNTIAF